MRIFAFGGDLLHTPLTLTSGKWTPADSPDYPRQTTDQQVECARMVPRWLYDPFTQQTHACQIRVQTQRPRYTRVGRGVAEHGL